MSVQIPRKWPLRAGGQRNVFAKGANESGEHVLMKALLWALYLPTYPDLTVEVRIGDRYKPDLVSLNEMNEPIFWGESGKVSRGKIYSLGRRFPKTHFAIAKWDMNLNPLRDLVSKELNGLKRHAPFDLIRFPPNSMTRFIDDGGQINITFDDIEWIRLAP